MLAKGGAEGAGEAAKGAAEAVKNGAAEVAKKVEEVGGFEKPLLAMLGGFSTDVVYQIMERLVAAVGTMVRGDATKQMEAKEQEMKARADEDVTKNKFQLASDLMKVQDQIASGMSTEDVQKQIGSLLGKLTDTGQDKPLMGKE